ncbi:uncharacterized protein LOC143029846 [Oratosquilla oratoria]|uniref:uncharacterized protein LOC143029846 n=1 Tax=Oratosquilla oratoria TaxID=337810 RepID=UPI003F763197
MDVSNEEEVCSNETVWLRRLGDLEEYFLAEGSSQIAVSLTLRSLRKFEEEEFRKAHLLLSSVPTLHVCIDDHKGKPWYRKRSADDQNNLSFLEEPSADTIMKHHTDMLHHKYTANTGPMWCLKIIHISKEDHDQRNALTEELHTYALVFGFHHSITDGNSNFLIIGHFVAMLERMIKGETQISTEQNFQFTPPTQTELLTNWEYVKLQLLPWNKRREVNFLKDVLINARPKLLELSPSTHDEKMTRVVRRNFDESLSKEFFHRCKRESITIHSGFSAVIDLAMAVVMKKAGLVADDNNNNTFTITCSHTINLRRYWWGDTSAALGTHISGIVSEQKVDPNTLENGDFWSLALDLHKRLQKDIRGRGPCRLLASYGVMLKEDPDIESHSDPPSLCYTNSNMGLVDKYFPASSVAAQSEDSTCHLEVVDIVQSSSLHNCRLLMLINFLTLRGRLLYSIDYNTEWVTDQTAVELADVIKELLQKSIE